MSESNQIQLYCFTRKQFNDIIQQKYLQHIQMKLAKSNSIKIHKDFSLPKLQSKIMNNIAINQFNRLNFPRRDDSSLIAGVGRKHFNSNNYSSLKKIINPELKDDQLNRGIRNYRSIGSQHAIEKLQHKQKIKNAIQNKLYLGDEYHPIYTEVAQAPYARDYHYKKGRKQKTQVSQHKKDEKKQHFKLKTELDVKDVDRNKYSKKLGTGIHQNQGLPKNYYQIEQKIKPKQSIQDQAHNINQSLLYKMYSTPQPMNLNKIQHRLYNPTYISSQF